MGSFDIEWKRSALKDLKKIDRNQITRILESVESLVSDPFPPNSRRLKGAENTYRLRVGNYRVIYQVETWRARIVIYYVRHRKDAYR